MDELPCSIICKKMGSITAPGLITLRLEPAYAGLQCDQALNSILHRSTEAAEIIKRNLGLKLSKVRIACSNSMMRLLPMVQIGGWPSQN